MNKLIAVFMLLMLSVGVSAQAAQKLYVNATFHRDNPPEIEGVEVIQSSQLSSFYRLEEDYSFRVLLANGTSREFAIPLDFVSPGYTANGSDNFEVDNISKEFWLPYEESATELQIVEDGFEWDSVEINGKSGQIEGTDEGSTVTGIIYLLALAGVGVLLLYLYSRMEVKGR